MDLRIVFLLLVQLTTAHANSVCSRTAGGNPPVIKGIFQPKVVIIKKSELGTAVLQKPKYSSAEWTLRNPNDADEEKQFPVAGLLSFLSLGGAEAVSFLATDTDRILMQVTTKTTVASRPVRKVDLRRQFLVSPYVTSSGVTFRVAERPNPSGDIADLWFPSPLSSPSFRNILGGPVLRIGHDGERAYLGMSLIDGWMIPEYDSSSQNYGQTYYDDSLRLYGFDQGELTLNFYGENQLGGLHAPAVGVNFSEFGKAKARMLSFPIEPLYNYDPRDPLIPRSLRLSNPKVVTPVKVELVGKARR